MSLRSNASPKRFSDGSTERKPLIEIVQRLLRVTQSKVDSAHAIEGLGFPGAVSHRAPEQQGLIVVIQRLLALPEVVVDPADVVERVGFSRRDRPRRA